MQSPIHALPLELLELICDVSANEIDRQHVRAQLRSCCAAFRSNLKPEASCSASDRAACWLRHGLRIDLLITWGLVNKSNILSIVAASGRNDLLAFAHIFIKIEPEPDYYRMNHLSRLGYGRSEYHRTGGFGPHGVCSFGSHGASSFMERIALTFIEREALVLME